MSVETKQKEIADLQQIVSEVNEQLEESFALDAQDIEKLEAMRDAALKEIADAELQISRNEVFGHLENEKGEKFIAGPDHAEPAIGVDAEPIPLKSEEGKKLKKSGAKAASSAKNPSTSISAMKAVGTPENPIPGYRETPMPDGEINVATDLSTLKTPLDKFHYYMNHGYDCTKDNLAWRLMEETAEFYGLSKEEGTNALKKFNANGMMTDAPDWGEVSRAVNYLQANRKDYDSDDCKRNAILAELRQSMGIKERFEPTTHEEFDWVHWKILECDLEKDALKKSYEAAVAEVEHRQKGLNFLYGRQLEEYCKAECERTGKKTVKFSRGKCTFTAQTAEWVLDTSAGGKLKLKNWLANNQPLHATLKIERYDEYRYEKLDIIKEYAENQRQLSGEIQPGLEYKEANEWAAFKVKAT